MEYEDERDSCTIRRYRACWQMWNAVIRLRRSGDHGNRSRLTSFHRERAPIYE